MQGKVFWRVRAKAFTLARLTGTELEANRLEGMGKNVYKSL
jgi:hypothetical protein